MRRLLIAFLALSILPIGGYYALTSGITLAEGGFTPKPVYAFTAPDDGSFIVVTKRIAFPPSEFADPSIIVNVQLHETHTHRIMASERLALEEDSDLREPSVEWTELTVHLRGIDSRQPRVITLPRNP